jgi:hypothetical protein
MKTEYKVEGDVLKLSINESKDFDTDGDGEISIKAAIVASVEVDGSEVLAELLKSSTLAQKAQELLGKMGLK